jgi:hypothetical protein
VTDGVSIWDSVEAGETLQSDGVRLWDVEGDYMRGAAAAADCSCEFALESIIIVTPVA